MIVLNEKKYAERIFESGTFEGKPYYDLQIMARYLYYVNGYRKKRIEKKLLSFLNDNYIPYRTNKLDWADTVESIAAKAGKYPLSEIDSVSITQSELDSISKLESPKHQRVAFTLLCIAKFGNMKNAKNNGWVNTELKEIFKIARVSATIVQQDYIIGDLGIAGLLEFPKQNGNLSSRVTFINDNSPIVLDVPEIDFMELSYAYRKYCGENIIRCKNCGILTPGGKTKRKKYCNNCSANTIMEVKTITCVDCGIKFETNSKNNRTCRCVTCQEKYRKEYYKNAKRKQRTSV